MNATKEVLSKETDTENHCVYTEIYTVDQNAAIKTF